MTYTYILFVHPNNNINTAENVQTKTTEVTDDDDDAGTDVDTRYV
jgi:hypothetical protein